MAVALVINGIPGPQVPTSGAGLEALALLLSDRRKGGCTITPSEVATFGIEYRIEHPNHSVEVAYLTDFQDPACP
jgi:hypothetical protein